MNTNKSVGEMLDQYFEAEKSLHRHFGFEELWRILPIDDLRGKHWFVNEWIEKVVWSDSPFTKELIEDGKVYDAGFYGNRHLRKAVMRTDDYTMVAIDTNCDFNVVLAVFENRLEMNDDELKEFYDECW